MSKLIINKLSIVDYKNKKANEFSFSPLSNLIISESNGQGKSSLVKSIYYGLGANLRSFPNGWEPKEYIFQIEVTIDGSIYIIKRHNNVMSVKDQSESFIFRNNHEYSEWLQNKLGMSLKIPQINTKTTSLAYVDAILSIFYIDQDKGWNGNIFRETFEGVRQYGAKNFPKVVFDYFLGLSNEQLQNKEIYRDELKIKINLINDKLKQIQDIYETYQREKGVVEYPPEEFEKLIFEIEQYITITNKLSKEIQKVTDKIEKEKRKLDIYKQDNQELELLLKDTKIRYKNIAHECSYCHSKLTREQSLTRLELEDNRLAINVRREELISKIKNTEEIVKKNQYFLNSLDKKYNTYNKHLEKIESLPNIKHYINQSVLAELKELEYNELSKKFKVEKNISEVKKEITNLKKELSIKSNTAKGEFEQIKNDITKLIGSVGIASKAFGDYRKLTGSGTNLNRDLLSIYLVYMNLLSRQSNFILPLSIDSFVKNETDKKSLAKMFSAINSWFLTLPNQVFFSVIEENLVFLDKATNKIQVKSPLLKTEYYSKISKEIIEHNEI